jgi:hypothetical protein
MEPSTGAPAGITTRSALALWPARFSRRLHLAAVVAHWRSRHPVALSTPHSMTQEKGGPSGPPSVPLGQGRTASGK